MPVTVGRTLRGRYQITDLLGHGGMADVYKAWDSHRQYHVAVKVMREDLAEDPEFGRRFQREATALAQLAHENIVRFYSFEQEDLTAFIVMDYIEGSTLRAELARAKGPLPADRVLSVTRQVCAALHYAHVSGVLHRDIKPGNIMVEPGGRALLSDFGIAKVADAGTATAVMPGTPAYMSPEHCLSRPLDARADIYSLGVVVYEMLAGRRPFSGESPGAGTGTTAERIRWEHLHSAAPSPRQLNPNIPPQIEAVVLTALEKSRERRWPTVLAFWQALAASAGVDSSLRGPQATPAPVPPGVAAGGAPSAPPSATTTPPTTSRPASSSRVPMIAAAVAGVLLLGVLLIACLAYALSRAGGAGTPTSVALLGATDMADDVVTPNPTVGPGGTPPATATADAELWPRITAENAAGLELLSSFQAHEQWVYGVDFSPDGRLLATASNDGTVRLWKTGDWSLVSTSETHGGMGGPDAGVVFSPDGALVASASAQGGVYVWRVPELSSVVAFEREGDAINDVTFSPDGRTLAAACADRSVHLWRVEDWLELPAVGSFEANALRAVYSPDGQLLATSSGEGGVKLWRTADGGLEREFLNDQMPLGIAFSPAGETLAATYYDGTIKLWSVGDGGVLRDLEGQEKFGCSVAFSSLGDVLAGTAADHVLRLWRVSDGALLKAQQAGERAPVYALAFSPDGGLIATGANDGHVMLWAVRGDTQVEVPTSTPAAGPTATARGVASTLSGTGGGVIAFQSDREGNYQIYAMNADGSNVTKLTTSAAPCFYPNFSADGEYIAYGSSYEGNDDIYVMKADGSGVARLTDDPGIDIKPAWSPDGTRLAFVSKRDGNWEVYVMNADGSGQTNLTNNPAEDRNPAWSPDGEWIAFESFRDGEGDIYVMSPDGSGVARLENGAAGDMHPAWSPDGKRIAFLSNRSSQILIHVMDSSGGNVQAVTALEDSAAFRPAWSPDGGRIAYSSERYGAMEIYVVNLADGSQTNLTNHPANDGWPSWAP